MYVISLRNVVRTDFGRVCGVPAANKVMGYLYGAAREYAPSYTSILHAPVMHTLPMDIVHIIMDYLYEYQFDDMLFRSDFQLCRITSPVMPQIKFQMIYRNTINDITWFLHPVHIADLAPVWHLFKLDTTWKFIVIAGCFGYILPRERDDYILPTQPRSDEGIYGVLKMKRKRGYTVYIFHMKSEQHIAQDPMETTQIIRAYSI
jgi:hypothetical protein